MKWLSILLLLFITLFCSNSVIAQEEIQTKYFGVGATVEEIDQAEFSVSTDGATAGEGFVFTTDQIHSGEKVNFSVVLKGNETLQIKLVETDVNGKFIKEQTSPAILLEDTWKEFKYQTKLAKHTKQIDIFVITDSAKKSVFKFRDALIN
ncbi:hypothetical protein [Ornithinibacillus halotolerans]|uniref:CBM6 domain-containing protein n=1 Tax=Ornithinibacillus halotolerans TaxID=1274357 RepID=A0A916S4V5_9BACI|nr:hypothetical protein [Ornithinibacillus halotolerans]GGA81108.1 hypothetical protein GCM10008025_25570 [Ornithinibacillus halotolerans]